MINTTYMLHTRESMFFDFVFGKLKAKKVIADASKGIALCIFTCPVFSLIFVSQLVIMSSPGKISVAHIYTSHSDS